uniref:Uncharacterized protein n=1 Tax=viral metagenome TaxID=1070528 RepID=A0A6C0JRC5_9ZZZZ
MIGQECDSEYDQALDSFMDVCRDLSFAKVKEYMAQPSFDMKMLLTQGDVYCCSLLFALRTGRIAIVEYFLTFIDVIPIEIWAEYSVHRKFDVDDIELVRLLLNHGKFSGNIFSYLRPESISTEIANQLDTLFNEYKFRLDGPVYNENII